MDGEQAGQEAQGLRWPDADAAAERERFAKHVMGGDAEKKNGDNGKNVQRLYADDSPSDLPVSIVLIEAPFLPEAENIVVSQQYPGSQNAGGQQHEFRAPLHRVGFRMQLCVAFVGTGKFAAPAAVQERRYVVGPVTPDLEESGTQAKAVLEDRARGPLMILQRKERGEESRSLVVATERQHCLL